MPTSSASYLAADASAGISDYGERQRAGETISTSFVESADNLVISKRPKRSSRCDGARGVHVRLQIRTRFLNDTLVEDCRRCHPGFTHTDRQDQAG